jgi:hypothetical protein
VRRRSCSPLCLWAFILWPVVCGHRFCRYLELCSQPSLLHLTNVCRLTRSIGRFLSKWLTLTGLEKEGILFESGSNGTKTEPWTVDDLPSAAKNQLHLAI